MPTSKRRPAAKGAKLRRRGKAGSRQQKPGVYKQPTKKRPLIAPTTETAILSLPHHAGQAPRVVTVGDVDAQTWLTVAPRPQDQENAKRAREESARRAEEITRREAEISRFVEEQRQKREWINFAEIADFCARHHNPFVADEAARSGAYDLLCDALLAGDFEENSKSCVRFLNPHSRGSTGNEWISRRRTSELQDEPALSLPDLMDTVSPGDVRTQYLAYCWIPRRMFDRWLAKRGLPSSPPRFEPYQAELAIPSADEIGKIKPPFTHSPNAPRQGPRPVKFERVKSAMRRDIEEGRRTVDSLKTMFEKDLASDYRVSRDTARRARKVVLSEFVENSISTNDK